MDLRDMEYWGRMAMAENLTQKVTTAQLYRLAQAETEVIQSWVDDVQAKINDLRGVYRDDKANAARWSGAMADLKNLVSAAPGVVIKKPRRPNGV